MCIRDSSDTTGIITLSGEDFNTGGAITFTGGSYTVANGSTDLTIVTSNDTVDFNAGTVTVGNNAFNIDTDTTGASTGANITFDGKILADTTQVDSADVLSDLSFDAGAGTATVTVTDIGYNGSADVNEINSVALTGGTISTNGKINTHTLTTGDKGSVTITGALSLAGNTTIETDTAASQTLDGAISITSTTNATGSETLTINSGSGAVDFGGLIGGTDGLGTVAINTTAGTSGNLSTGTIAIAGIGSADGTSEAGTDSGSTFTAGNTNTVSITLDGDMYFTDGNTLFEAASGNTIINNQSTGAVTDFITAADSIEFKGGTLYVKNTGVKIATSNGAVTINSIDGIHDETVEIAAGSGAVSVGRIGGTNNAGEGIKSVAITSSNATGITLSGNITTSDLSLIHI